MIIAKLCLVKSYKKVNQCSNTNNLDSIQTFIGPFSLSQSITNLLLIQLNGLIYSLKWNTIKSFIRNCVLSSLKGAGWRCLLVLAFCTGCWRAVQQREKRKYSLPPHSQTPPSHTPHPLSPPPLYKNLLKMKIVLLNFD